MKVLIAEDYPPLRKSLVRGLSENGYVVESVSDGSEALDRIRDGDYDAVILDVMLPSLDGFSILKRVRRDGNHVSVLVLTARDQVSDRVRGLELGADDYLVKPFAFEELLARVQVLVRRRYDRKSPRIIVGDLEVDTTARVARRGGVAIDLSAREYAILEYLAHRAGQIVSRAAIREHVYDFASEPNSNVIDVTVGHLRRKLEDGGRPRLVHTRRGMGYVMEEAT